MGVLSGFFPIVRALVFAGVGLGVGIALATLITAVTNQPDTEVRIALGYIFALIGWLLGIGVWDYWARE
jgi:phosphotransferase system  glucose/maltose/N-acetylglucosamine-specific IIC component